MIKNILGREFRLPICTDSKTISEGIVGINAASEEQLMIDLKLIRKTYEIKEIAEVV